jgi:hypothetical protein
MKSLWVFGVAGVLLMVNSAAKDPTPIPRMSSTCPLGYARNGAYCVPAAGKPKPALPRVSSVCPPGYYRSGAYCVQNGGQ